jgi:hypothetical protein
MNFSAPAHAYPHFIAAAKDGTDSTAKPGSVLYKF